MPYPCTWKRQPCHRPRQTAGPSSRAPERTVPAPPGLHSTLLYSPGDQPGVASAQDDLRYYRPHTLLAGAGLGEAALDGGPPGLGWVYDLGAHRTQGSAVDIGSDQSPSDLVLRPPGRTLTWEPGTSGSSSGTNQGVARSVLKSLCSNWGDLCSHSSWHLYGLGCQCLVGMFGHEYSWELSLDGQLQLMAQGLTWGVQAGVCV